MAGELAGVPRPPCVRLSLAPRPAAPSLPPRHACVAYTHLLHCVSSDWRCCFIFKMKTTRATDCCPGSPSRKMQCAGLCLLLIINAAVAQSLTVRMNTGQWGNGISIPQFKFLTALHIAASTMAALVVVTCFRPNHAVGFVAHAKCEQFLYQALSVRPAVFALCFYLWTDLEVDLWTDFPHSYGEKVVLKSSQY